MNPERYNKLTPDQQVLYDELAGIYEANGNAKAQAEELAVLDIKRNFSNHLTEKQK